MDGQRIFATLVDLAFFAVVALLGIRRVISEPILAALLSSYAAHRFGVAMGKQQAVVALSGGQNGPGSSNPPGARTTTTTTTTNRPPSEDGRASPTELAHRLRTVEAQIGWIG